MNTYANTYRKKHRKLGLCEDCPRKARKGKRQCAQCAARSRAKYHKTKRDLIWLRAKLAKLRKRNRR